MYYYDVDLIEMERTVRDAYLDLAHAGVSQTRMVQVTGVSQSRLSDWLRGQARVVKLDTLYRLNEAIPELAEMAE